jgi:NodT family efflux transporter outer membrane factor (OMF) lipoprotein
MGLGVHARIVAVSLTLGAVGCMVGPDYVAPQPPAPDTWQVELTRGLAEGKADFETWWTLLEDPELTALVGRSIAGSLTLRQAAERVEVSRAGLGIAKGRQVPEVDATGLAGRERFSDNVEQDTRSGEGDLFSLGLDASWELDLWGRIRRSVQSASAAYEASVEDYRDVLVTFLAEVADRYVEVRTLQLRIRYATQNIELQRDTLGLTIDRRNVGLAGDLDVHQAEMNLARTEALLPRLRQDLATVVHRLGVLTGQLPGALAAELQAERPIPAPPGEVLVGLPADLLRQRPDVRAAERALASQSAQIGATQALLYPTFSLSGTFQMDSSSVGDWFTWQSRSFGVGPTLRWNLFSGGRIRSQVRAEEARTAEALAAYEEVVLRSYEEVENAMVAFEEEQVRRDALERSVTAAARSSQLVEQLYRLGLTDFQNVLDTQRVLFEQQDALARSQGLVTRNVIAVYKALGGGWAP